MQSYVAGLMFNEARDRVALVLKNRPDWQRGKFNAIGGKIESTDHGPFTAMEREFKEETGVLYDGWTPFVRLFRQNEYEVFFFLAFTDKMYDVTTVEDEPVFHYSVEDAVNYLNVLPNLKWMIPMALDPCVGKGRFIEIEDVAGN